MSSSNQHQMFARVQQWQQSGLSQKAWCEQNNMAYHVFHYWYKRFRHQPPESEAATKSGFVQLQVQDRFSGTPWCELVLANGQKLFFHQPVPAAFIRTILE
jgi:hypothetical protein